MVISRRSRGIHAYHSSPHVSSTDASKIGTGEGAQIGGHGITRREPAVSGQGGEY
jgi:hypothetical protein